MKIKPSLYLIILCSIIISGCDLFSASVQSDFLNKIDGEISWANAKRLSVRVDYPGEWGSSSPPAGLITPSPRDIRQGFAFELEFTPDAAYSFKGWRAYASSDLGPVSVQGNDWRLNQTLLDGISELEDVLVPAIAAEGSGLTIRGGTGEFTINTIEAVTLVPWCETEPYVIRTDPRSETQNSTDMRTFHPSTDIMVYFNAALDPDIVWKIPDNAMPNGLVWIEARPISSISAEGDFTPHNEWFDRIEYESRAGLHTLTIIPKKGSEPGNTGPEFNYQIKITIGKNIRNAQGNMMTAEEVLYYKVAELEGAEAEFTNWSAVYYEESGTMTLSCDIAGANAADEATFVNGYCQINQGANLPFDISRDGISSSFTGTIAGVGRLDDSGIREGRSAGNIREYRIFVELYAGGYHVDDRNFKIWNFPGMSVSKANPAIEVTSEDGDYEDSGKTIGLSKIVLHNIEGQYVLANDITINTEWTPIGNDGIGANIAPFAGKFYGGGRTITLNSGIANTEYRGLFGFTEGSSAAHLAEIRDLAVAYANTETTGSSDTYMGGVVGFANNTNIRNVIVLGANFNAALSITPSNTSVVRLGGIAGYFEGSGKIENCYAGLSVKYNPGSSGDMYIGAVAGETGKGTGEYIAVHNGYTSPDPILAGLLINGVSAAANVSADKGNYSGQINVGGAVGKSGQNTMRDLLSRSAVFFSRNAYVPDYMDPVTFNNCGGLAGQIALTNFDNCFFNGDIEISGANPVTGRTHLGGIFGYNDAFGISFINDCRVRGNINFKGNNRLYIGGIIGYSLVADPFSSPRLTITNTFYEGGVITISNSSYTYAGGFAGELDNSHVVALCGSLGGSLVINTTAELYAGGFISFVGSTIINNCFSRMNLDLQSNAGNFYAGGFAGHNNGTIKTCYASGNVNALNSGFIPGPSDFFIGGLAGYNTGTVSNCYALGDITADRLAASGDSSAGGLVGYAIYGNSKIQYSFSKEQKVKAKSLNGHAYAGGIIGSYNPYSGSSLNNNIALGSLVSAAAATAAQAHTGRVSGFNPGTDNYAINTMRIGSGAYDDYILGAVQSTGTGTATIHGENVTNSDSNPGTQNTAWWQEIFDISANTYRNSWDYSTVSSLNHPVLAGTPGQ